MNETTDFPSATVRGFLDQVAARTPAPSGGAACAVAVGTAAALVAMAARFSTRQLPDADRLAANADELRAEALPLADADAEVYGELLAASRDKGPGHEERFAEACRAACDVPLRMSGTAVRVAELATRVGTEGNPNLRGDAYTAVMLCSAAAESAAALVGINARAGNLDDERVRRAAGQTLAVARAVTALKENLGPPASASG
ncbi:cyclodeaminase/cyclohydrolase family protein [Streptomyces bathyalis]|uniref:Cyclodeaminase/cyclohydrolase family protein n=1 Tax=Streptomyces bathyalis TaxID=2710756 RepID=A0A7T1TC22_9ACTN|nr:cyclodeaminase/cyclohydrolase family protein [Streptomyces bathyalis]QPP10222.1 cyclodeaminase/cyclohydrolase family protein [Streptomyces bathyalis]